MATDGPDPTPCDYEIFRDGTVVLISDSISSNRMEGWVKKVAQESGQRVDWHFVAGRATVKALGDLQAVNAAIGKHIAELSDLQRASATPSLIRAERATETKEK